MIVQIGKNELVKIGKNDSSRKHVRPVIVRFTTFKQRTMLYWARKNLHKDRVHLDLTKERFTLYQKSKKFVKSVYVDVNCRLKVKFKNNKESFFFFIYK